nr:MAG TPA: hypothetical protein [Bacteriophage sp.]
MRSKWKKCKINPCQPYLWLRWTLPPYGEV